MALLAVTILSLTPKIPAAGPTDFALL